VIPLSGRAAAVIEARRASQNGSPQVFSAPTKTGHVGESSLKRQHLKAIKDSKVPAFVLHECRHTCLRRRAEHMDPHTLAYLAGHSEFSSTRRYVHPQADTVRAALERVRSLVEGGLTAGDLSGAGRNQRLNPPN